jgi:hypothetical protein
VPGLADLNSDQQNKGLEAWLSVDRDTASRLGLTMRDIDSALYDAFGQRQVSTMYTELNQYHVVLEVAPRYWQSRATLKTIYVHSQRGVEVPLAAFTRLEPSTTPLQVAHQGQFPSVTISFNLREGVSLGQAVDAVEKTEYDLGVPAAVHGSFSETAQEFVASLSNEPVLIITALITVFIVLGILYESTIHPITILSTLPSAGVGALLALMLFRMELTVISLIGIILLIGIVKKNAILMIDFALDAANAQASAADLENMRLSMRGNLAADYFQMLGLDMQARLLSDTISAYEKALRLTIDRHNSGIASRVDVTQAEAQLESTRAQLSDVAVARSQMEHAVAVLAGQDPSSFSIPAGTIRNLPPTIPVGVPSLLLERRPDIAGAERRVAAANAQIGLAEVAYYPLVSLTANGGLESGSIRNLLSWPSRVWALGGYAAQTLLDFGHRRALTQQAEANYDATVAAYRQTVLSAFQEVEDRLSALRLLAQEQAQQEAAVKASQEALQLELDRYKSGIVSYLDVITSQTVALTNQRAAVALIQRRMTAAVQLILAIGGGWTAGAFPSP